MSSDVTLAAAVLAGRLALERAGLSPDTAAIDAEVLAREVLGWDRATYLARRQDGAPAAFGPRYAALLERRSRREPVAQILGRREFWGREFAVTRDVLTPRPETELIVETVLARWPSGCEETLVVADVGTGSGCLAVTLALEWPAARIVATDVSGAALAVARRNVARYGLIERISLVETDLLAAVRPGVDLVVSNPPYVPDGARPVLPRDVRDYEPAAALFGGASGFELIERLLDEASARIVDGGLLVMEFGAGQDDEIQARVRRRPGLELAEIRNDLQGIPRVAVIRREAASS